MGEAYGESPRTSLQVEAHPLLIYHLLVSLNGFLLCLQLILQLPNLCYGLIAKVYHHLGCWIRALRVHHYPSQFWVLVREELILVILHILELMTTETYASFSGCIFYAVLHGNTVSMMCIV